MSSTVREIMDLVVQQHMTHDSLYRSARRRTAEAEEGLKALAGAAERASLGLRFADEQTIETEAGLHTDAAQYQGNESVFVVGSISAGKGNAPDRVFFRLVFADSSSRQFFISRVPCVFTANTEAHMPSVHLAGITGDNMAVVVVQLTGDFGGGGPRFVFSRSRDNRRWYHWFPELDGKTIGQGKVKAPAIQEASDFKSFYGLEDYHVLERFVENRLIPPVKSKLRITRVPVQERIHGVAINEFKHYLLKRAYFDVKRPEYSTAVMRTMQHHSLRLEETEQTSLNEEIARARRIGSEEARAYARLANRVVNRKESPPEKPLLL